MAERNGGHLFAPTAAKQLAPGTDNEDDDGELFIDIHRLYIN